ncbi:DEAD/DEAH box helicase, partial [Candidatus Saccharibacteria bacterium]|nr:DEAD/DEAH box helicase [Candidatus Saccharibacteria bacterium]
MAPESPFIPVESDEPQVAEAGAATSDQLTEQEAQAIGARIGSIVLENTVLREHQHDAFNDLVSFYQSGGREGYIKLPTSTGKTVLFVTLVDQFIALSKKQGTPARAVVLTPTTQLAGQTIGGVSKTGKLRGFKGFAPELDARAVHSSKSNKQNATALKEADVVSTTYDTFRNMIEAFVALEGVDPEELSAEINELKWQQPVIERQIKMHKHDADEYLRLAYKKQLVRFFRQDVGAFLDKQSERPLADADVQLLKSVKELIDMTEGDPRGLSMVRRLVAKKMNQNVKDQLTKWQMRAEEASIRAK